MVHVKVAVPKELSPKQAELMKAFAQTEAEATGAGSPGEAKTLMGATIERIRRAIKSAGG